MADEGVGATGDQLILSAREDDLERCAERHRLDLDKVELADLNVVFADGLDVAEIVVVPRSDLVGKSLLDMDFRENFGVNVLGIWRDGRPRRTHLGAAG